MLKALIFDFDGLILDTETPEYDVLQEIYTEFDKKLSVEKLKMIMVASSYFFRSLVPSGSSSNNNPSDSALSIALRPFLAPMFSSAPAAV